IMEMENLMGIPREHLAFAVWYLKNKQYVTSGESSDIVITSEGIDYLESNLPTSRVAYKLLKAAEKGTTRTDRTDQAAPNPARGARRQAPRVVQGDTVPHSTGFRLRSRARYCSDHSRAVDHRARALPAKKNRADLP